MIRVRFSLLAPFTSGSMSAVDGSLWKREGVSSILTFQTMKIFKIYIDHFITKCGGGYLLKEMIKLSKQRSFIMKYQSCYSKYNFGKSHAQRKRNRRLGNKEMRNKLKREMVDIV